jgi:hypothetical protein
MQRNSDLNSFFFWSSLKPLFSNHNGHDVYSQKGAASVGQKQQYFPLSSLVTANTATTMAAIGKTSLPPFPTHGEMGAPFKGNSSDEGNLANVVKSRTLAFSNLPCRGRNKIGAPFSSPLSLVPYGARQGLLGLPVQQAPHH